MRTGLISSVLIFLMVGISTGLESSAYEATTQEEMRLVRGVINGNYDVVAEAIQNKYGIGKDVVIMTLDGFPLLAYAINNSDVKMANLLIAYGADVNATSPSGYPMLHLAVGKQSLPMVRLLVRTGAELSVPVGNPPITAFDLAQVKGNAEIESFLRRYGAAGWADIRTEQQPKMEQQLETGGFWEGARKQEGFTEGLQYGFNQGVQGNTPWYFHVMAFAIVALFAFLAWKGAEKRGRSPWIWGGITGLCILLPFICWIPYVVLRTLGASTKQQIKEDEGG